MREYWRKIWGAWDTELSRTTFAAVAAQSNFVSVGFTQGFSAIILPQLKVTDQESSWIAGLGVIWTPVGSLVSGLLVDYLGRRRVLFLPNFLFFISWLLIGLAPSVTVLYYGRGLGGLAAGMVTSSYLYVCEISQTNNRGMLSALGPVFVSLGVLLVYTMGFLFEWHTVAFIATLACIVSNALIFLIPESPSWYVSTKQDEKALKSLQWLRRDDIKADKELIHLTETFNQLHPEDFPEENQKHLIKQAVIKAKQMQKTLFQPDVYKPFLIILFFFFFQEGSGIYIILFYSVQIFKEFGTNYDEKVVTITTGVLRFFMSILGTHLMSKFGRRQLSIFSGTCISLSLFIVSLYLFIVPMMNNPIHFLPVMCIFFHVGFSMTGFLQIPFILSSELFPARCRGLMGGITCSLAYVLIFVSVKLYPEMLRLIKIEGVLISFFVFTTIGVVFLFFCLPETKDKSFEEISSSFIKKPKDKTMA